MEAQNCFPPSRLGHRLFCATGKACARLTDAGPPVGLHSKQLLRHSVTKSRAAASCQPRAALGHGTWIATAASLIIVHRKGRASVFIVVKNFRAHLRHRCCRARHTRRPNLNENSLASFGRERKREAFNLAAAANDQAAPAAAPDRPTGRKLFVCLACLCWQQMGHLCFCRCCCCSSKIGR